MAPATQAARQRMQSDYGLASLHGHWLARTATAWPPRDAATAALVRAVGAYLDVNMRLFYLLGPRRDACFG